ncbi:chromosome segregation ATPase [Lederbergia galactosidilyticus]|uniref:hypothetical protein n=1 Tax=Lederbergia galactosidilytica TaxID=217031 RepID=UPI0007172A68|nr:hypothetical protein [Lederbergia galactosidilytica]MBP1916395.1 chromosome segregation ATPase [Lederbergia galactosidilytica]
MSEKILNQILVEIKEIKTDVSTLKEDVSTLKEDVSVLKEDVSTLKTDVSNLKEDVSTLKTDVSNLKEDVSTLKTDVSNLKDDVSTLKAEQQKTTAHMAKMDERLSNLELKQDSIYKQTGKLTEYHADTISHFEKLATKEDLEYFDKKTSEHEREIFKIKNA